MKKFNAPGYCDYIADNLEKLTIALVITCAVLYFYFKVGFLLTMLPWLAFHVYAYYRYRRDTKANCNFCADTKIVMRDDGYLETVDCPMCPLGK